MALATAASRARLRWLEQQQQRRRQRRLHHPRRRRRLPLRADSAPRRAPHAATSPSTATRRGDHRAQPRLPRPDAVRHRGTAPATVTLTGFVHVFSSGPDSNDVTVQVYDAAAGDGDRPQRPADRSAPWSPSSTRRPSAPVTPTAPRAARCRWPPAARCPRATTGSAAAPTITSTAATTAGVRVQRSPALGVALLHRQHPDQHAAGHPRQRASRRQRLHLGDDGGFQRLLVDERPRLHQPRRHRLPRQEQRGQPEVPAQRQRAVERRLRQHPDHLRAVGRHHARARARSPARSTTATTCASTTSRW